MINYTNDELDIR